MRVYLLIILAVILCGLASCKSNITDEVIAENPKEITAFQQYMIDEINLARTNPSAYAELRLKANSEKSTDNGSYLYLKNLAAVGVVTFSQPLNLSASDYANLLAEKNLVEHNADGTPLSRAIRAGFMGSSMGENIAAASASTFNGNLQPQTAAIEFVKILLIDEGVANLGHRVVMLNSKYKTLGIGFTSNTSLHFVVQDFGNQ
jgi:uncharacterized protein YkwD